jgi:hypothetical protein
MPAHAASHPACFLLAADAHDGTRQAWLTQDPGNRQINQGFLVTVGNFC